MLQKQRGQGPHPAGKQKEREMCTAKSQVFSTASAREGDVGVYSLYCGLPQHSVTKRETAPWVFPIVGYIAFGGWLCIRPEKKMNLKPGRPELGCMHLDSWNTDLLSQAWSVGKDKTPGHFFLQSKCSAHKIITSLISRQVPSNSCPR